MELDLTTGHETFASTTTVTFTATQPGATTFLELAAPTVREIALNGVALDPARVFDGDRITLAGLAEANRLTVVADCAYSRTGEGLHRFVDPVDDAVYLYTQFETYDAHRMYACFDQPDLKATFTLSVTAPADWTIISNGAVAAVAEAAIGVRVTRERKTYSSRKVTAPAFSIAPALNSGTNSWSYLPNGYR